MCRSVPGDAVSIADSDSIQQSRLQESHRGGRGKPLPSGSPAAGADCAVFSHPNQEMTMSVTLLARRVVQPVVKAGLLAVVLLALAPSSAQDVKGGKGKQPDFIPAGYDDYQNMLDQLGIKKM